MKSVFSKSNILVFLFLLSLTKVIFAQNCSSEFCDQNRFIQNTPIPSKVNANNSIVIGRTVTPLHVEGDVYTIPERSIEINAGNEIVFKSGTNIQNGSELIARIKECTPNEFKIKLEVDGCPSKLRVKYCGGSGQYETKIYRDDQLVSLNNQLNNLESGLYHIRVKDLVSQLVLHEYYREDIHVTKAVKIIEKISPTTCVQQLTTEFSCQTIDRTHFTWFKDGVIISNNSEIEVYGNGVYQLNTVDIHTGEQSSDAFEVTRLLPVRDVSIAEQISYSNGRSCSVKLTANFACKNTTKPVHYSWRADGVLLPEHNNKSTIVVSPYSDKVYTVYVLDLGFSLTATASINVSGRYLEGEPNIYAPAYVPLSPNNDGIGDIFAIRSNNDEDGYVKVDRVNCAIFDTWQNRVHYMTAKTASGAFRNTGYSEIWDGGTVPNGSYLYSMDVFNCSYPKGKNYSGWIILKGTNGQKQGISDQDDFGVANNVLIYPNPTKGIVNIENSTFSKIDIINANGIIVRTFDQFDSTYQMDLSDLEDGFYSLVGQQLDGTRHFEKISILK